MLWDVLTVAIVLWCVTSLKIFEFPYAFTQLEPSLQTYTTGVYTYALTFGIRIPIYAWGKAAATGMLTLLSIVGIVVLVRWVMRRETVQY